MFCTEHLSSMAACCCVLLSAWTIRKTSVSRTDSLDDDLRLRFFTFGVCCCFVTFSGVCHFFTASLIAETSWLTLSIMSGIVITT